MTDSYTLGPRAIQAFRSLIQAELDSTRTDQTTRKKRRMATGGAGTELLLLKIKEDWETNSEGTADIYDPANTNGSPIEEDITFVGGWGWVAGNPALRANETVFGFRFSGADADVYILPPLICSSVRAVFSASNLPNNEWHAPLFKSDAQGLVNCTHEKLNECPEESSRSAGVDMLGLQVFS